MLDFLDNWILHHMCSSKEFRAITHAKTAHSQKTLMHEYQFIHAPLFTHAIATKLLKLHVQPRVYISEIPV